LISLFNTKSLNGNIEIHSLIPILSVKDNDLTPHNGLMIFFLIVRGEIRIPVSPPGAPGGTPEGKDERERWSWGIGYVCPLP
jgi:hypothetical protein